MARPEVIYRHSRAVRITHWVNALVLLVLLMSGLQIFNAHPALYLGEKSDFDKPILAMRPMTHDNRFYPALLQCSAGTSILRACSGLAGTPTPDTRSAAFPGGHSSATAISPWVAAGTFSSPGCLSSTA